MNVAELSSEAKRLSGLLDKGVDARYGPDMGP